MPKSRDSPMRLDKRCEELSIGSVKLYNDGVVQARLPISSTHEFLVDNF